MLFDLTGRVAIVTGGSRGLGLEIALGLGEAGARLVITGRRAEWLDQAAGTLNDAGVEAHAVAADANDAADADRVLASTLNAFGRVDVLVNNAGITWGAPTLDMPLDRYRSVLDTNATSTFIMSQVLGRHWHDAKSPGRVINVASVVGLVGMPESVASVVGYTASKGAIIALTRDLAVKWAPHDILVNAIAPSFFPTRLAQRTMYEHEEAVLERLPIGRFPELWEIRGVVVFLASRASSYITGQVIAVDGGMVSQ